MISEQPTRVAAAHAIQPQLDCSLAGAAGREIANGLGAIAPNDRIPHLINQLANAQLQLRWELCYRTIFQSQIVILIMLSRGAMDRPTIERVYSEIVVNTPTLQGVTFNDWVRYLVNMGLVATTVDGFAITVAGQEFIVWKVRHLIPDKG